MGKKLQLFCVFVLTFGNLLLAVPKADAQSDGFALQVTPSPIVETITPGMTKEVELKVRNQSAKTETLAMTLRAFKVDGDTNEVQLQNEEPTDVKDWVKFAEPQFTVAAGEWYTQKITIATPVDAGFSYYFAIYISRAQPSQTTSGTTAIEGSVAVFTLLNTDRQDATRHIESVTLTSKKKVYDYLPAELELSLKNTGNTILKPGGNVYIQRGVDSNEPITVLPVNETGAYLLPNVSRTLTVTWKEGFPVKEKNDKGISHVVWNWANTQKFRFGKYTAKAVIVYNDGQRDVPVEAVVEFWVIPWKLLLLLLVIVVILIIGLITIVKKIVKAPKKRKYGKDDSKKEVEKPTTEQYKD